MSATVEAKTAEQEVVILTVAEHNELLYAQAKLNALEASGVDNWEWYDDAMEKLEQTT